MNIGDGHLEPALDADPPGNAILESLHVLGRVVRIVRSNADELERWLARTDEPTTMMTVWNADDRDQLDRHLDEVERCLFNFLSAAAARVHFYQAVKNRGFLNDAIGSEYEARVSKEFRMNGLHCWLIDLRNFMLHHRLPTTFARLTFSSEPTTSFESRVLIACNALKLRASDFSPSARDWMSNKDEVDLRSTIADYVAVLDRFDSWFGRAYAEHHLDACESYLELLNEKATTWLKGRSATS